MNHALVNTAERARRRGNTYTRAVLADSPLGYYHLGETSGTTMADSSGNARDGTYTGTYTLGQTGLVGAMGTDKSVRFNQGPGSVADATWHRLNTDFTIEFWFKMNTDPAASTFPGIIRRGSGSLGGWAVFYNSSRQLNFRRDTGAGRSSDSTGLLLPTTASGATAYFAITYNEAATTLKFYKDGSEVVAARNTAASWTDTTLASALTFGIGDTAGQGDHTLDEVAIYGTELSSARISAHYAAA